MKERVVDTREYVSVLREIAEEGKVVSMRIAGSSMSPFLCHNRDYIYFTKPDRELRKGDVVFYQRDSGQYVMHRICRVRPEGYYLVGDAQTQIEGPLRRDQIHPCEAQGEDPGTGGFLVGILRTCVDPDHTVQKAERADILHCRQKNQVICPKVFQTVINCDIMSGCSLYIVHYIR